MRRLLALGILCAPLVAAAFAIPPAPTAHVNDYANVLTPESAQQIEALLQKEETDTSTQIVVVTLPSLDGQDIADVTASIGKSWKIGQKSKDNGVIFAIAPTDRRMRIEVGRGLEGALTDLETHVIQDEVVKPAFLAGHIDQGILDGSRAIVTAVHGEFVGTHGKVAATHVGWKTVVPILVVVLLFLFSPRAGMLFLLMGALGRRGGGIGGGGGVGGGGGRDGDGGGFSGGGGSFGGGGSSSSW